MKGRMAARLFQSAIKRSPKNGDYSGLSLLFHPIKVIAAFFTAPVLLIRVAWKVNNPIRRVIAKVGILIAIICTYFAGTFLGTAVAALLIATKIGSIIGLGFFLGVGLSVFLSVLFQLFIFNTILYFFLQMSSQEVIDYLDKLSS